MNKKYSLDYRRDNMNRPELCFKRIFDVCVSLLLILLLSPLFLLFSLYIKYVGKRKVLSIKERIGKGGNPFVLYFFSTCDDTIKRGATSEKKSSPKTFVEKLLLKRDLYCLPLLWNVLRGDMSIVGPQPMSSDVINKLSEYTNDYEILYEMRPGVVSESLLYKSKSSETKEIIKRIELDKRYLQNRTLGLDFAVMANFLYFFFFPKRNYILCK